jgi:hypothetical protein
MLETPHFTVVSQWKDADTLAWAGEFSPFISALHHVLKVDEGQLPPLTIVLFRKASDFRAYDPVLEDGSVLPEGGFFGRQHSWSVIGLFAQGQADTRHVILHEGVHWYMSAYPRSRPLALEEGLAEVFSTFRTDASGREIFGDLLENDLRTVQAGTPLPVERLLAVTGYDPLAAHHGIGIFYAESWALAHYLMFSEDSGGGSALGRMLDAFGRRLGPEQAIREALGITPAELDLRLARYLQAGTYRVATFPRDPSAGIAGPIVPAPPAAVEVALAKLAAVSPGRAGLALDRAEAAIRIEPGSPDGYDLAALADERLGRPGPALEAAEAAIDRGSRNAWTWFLCGYERYGAASRAGACPPPTARRIADEAERAIALQPGLSEAYRQLAIVIGGAEPLTSDDARVFEEGARALPDDGWMEVGEAELEARRGDREGARALLEEALDRPGAFSPGDRTSVGRIAAGLGAGPG